MNIEHIAINVADPVAMAAWYTKNLGLHVVRSFASETFTHFLADESKRVVIETYRHAAAGIPDYAAMDPMVFHIAYATDKVKEVRERLLTAGATAVGDVGVTPAGDELAMLRDPWGVPIQLVKRAQPLV